MILGVENSGIKQINLNKISEYFENYQVDFSQEDHPDNLLKNTEHITTSKLRQQSHIWNFLTLFAADWNNKQHAFRQNIRNIWLEFDTASITKLEQQQHILHSPSVFWGPENNTTIDEALIQVMNTLAQVDMSVACLQSFQASLPEGAQLFQLGVMSSRQTPMARVCINKISYQDIIPLLQKSHWAGNNEALAEALSHIRPLVQSIALNLDITKAGIGEKIGLECYMNWENTEASQWQPLLDYLLKQKLLIPEKLDGLLSFPKNKKLALGKQLANTTTETVYPVFYQNIHHIKLTFTSDRFVEAKAYLGIYRPGLNKNILISTKPPEECNSLDEQWITT